MPLYAGAAVRDISPTRPMFLMGYTHTPRTFTSIHDPLFSSALYLTDEQTQLLFIANDILFVTKVITLRARQRISRQTAIPEGNIMVTATHTHSGPVTVDCLCSANDPVVPPADPEYLQRLEDGIVAAALEACRRARPAHLGLTVANGTGVGTNRRDSSGPSDLRVPLLMVRAVDGDQPIACMLACSMHPTVLHEDSFVVSGDFPGMARQYLQETVLGRDCPVVYHTGPCGNQSPRHVTRGNTLEEARRLGEILGRAVERAIPEIEYLSSTSLGAMQRFVDLPRRSFPSLQEAQGKLTCAIEKLERLRGAGAPRQEVRTAEVDWFGAEEAVTLAQAAQDGRLEDFTLSCLPGEVQILKVGRWSFVGWPGELFVEYALAVKDRCQDTFVISLANGELQGYIVTEEAAQEGGYEASNSLFSPQSGKILADTTLRMLGC